MDGWSDGFGKKNTPAMSPREAVDLQNANRFLSKMLSPERKAELQRSLHAAACVMASTGGCIDHALFDLTKAAEDALYEQHLTTGQDVDVMATTPIATRTSSDPHALAELSDATIVNRRNAWNKTFQKVTGSTDKPALPYVFHKDVQACAAAIAGMYTTYASWKLNAYNFANMCEAVGERDLADRYRKLFLGMEASRKKVRSAPREQLSAEQLATVHATCASLAEKATALVLATDDLYAGPTKDNRLGLVQHALIALLTFGTSPDWCNQRRASVTYVFKNAKTDVTKDNYIEIDGQSVTLVVNTATKVDKAVTLDVSTDCPALAALLVAIHGRTGRPDHLIHQHAWRQRKTFGRRLVDKSGFNQRLKEAIAFAALPQDIAKHIGGCNVARHAEVAANRKRPALTETERSDDRRKAAKRLSSVNAAETQYAQPASP